MKAALKRFTPARVRSFLGRLGRFMDPPPLNASLIRSLETLRGQGFQPRSALDIGAYHGEWARDFHRVFPAAAILMVEAQESKRPLLEAAVREIGPPTELAIGLLGAEDGREVTFCEMETGSSVFEESSHFGRARTTRRTETLDTLLARHPAFASADFLKLDTQGYELEILRGAGRLLPSARAVLLEASLIPVNRGCPLIADVMSFMTARGFTLFDHCGEWRRRDGVLWQRDLLFLSRHSGVKIESALTTANWG